LRGTVRNSEVFQWIRILMGHSHDRDSTGLLHLVQVHGFHR
jgi:hypothetical protein